MSIDRRLRWLRRLRRGCIGVRRIYGGVMLRNGWYGYCALVEVTPTVSRSQSPHLVYINEKRHVITLTDHKTSVHGSHWYC